MSSLSSGVGVSSGLDIASIIEQLLAADNNRRIPLQARLSRIAESRAALQQSQSLLLSLRTSAATLAQPSILFATSVTSSLPGVLSAMSTGGAATAALGSTSLLVRSLASASRFASAGLSSLTAALGADAVTVRFGAGRLIDDRELSLLRGGDGIPRGRIRITDRSGQQATVDLRDALSIDDVLRAINEHEGIDVEARLRADGRGIEIVDTSSGTGVMKVQEWGSGTTAASLGIAGSDLDGDGVISGSTIAFLGEETPLWSLGGGVPITDGAAEFMIVVDGQEIAIDLGAGADGVPLRAATIGDVLDRIDAALAAAGVADELSVAIAPGGDRLRVTYSGAGTVSFIDAISDGAESGGGASALRALGLDVPPFAGSSAPNTPAIVDGARLVFGMHDIGFDRLDGGAGLSLAGSLTITDRAGRSVTIGNFDGVDSVQTLLDRLRAEAAAVPGMDLDIGLDAGGSRLRIVDQSDGSGTLIVSGDAAATLGLGVVDSAHGDSAVIQSRDLRRADIGWGTPLAQLGAGSMTGSFRITAASGASAVINVTAGMTVHDLARAVDAAPIPVSLRLNALGDAIEIVDESAITGPLVVEDVTGDAAAARIAGTSTTGRIDGTRTVTLDLTGNESAEELAALLHGIAGVDAQLSEDDSGNTILMVTSSQSGARHGLVVSIDGVDLGLTTVTQARDARVLLSPGTGNGTLVTSETNLLTSAIAGLTLELRSVSDDLVTVTVSPSHQALKNSVTAFVAALTSAMANLRAATAVDVDAGTRGPLYGNSIATRARESLRSLIGRTFGPDGKRLASIGITLGPNGAVAFDESRLTTALEDDPDGVRDLLAADNGVAARFEDVMAALVDPEAGAFGGDDERLARAADNASSRIDRIDEAIERRRLVLYARFIAMEAAIERLQVQQSTLQSLLGSVG